MLTHHIPFSTKWECSTLCAIIDRARHGLPDTLIQQSAEPMGKPAALMTKNDKVSSYFGISKFTLYSYSESGKESKNKKNQQEE